jgi:hypothetical protein
MPPVSDKDRRRIRNEISDLIENGKIRPEDFDAAGIPEKWRNQVRQAAFQTDGADEAATAADEITEDLVTEMDRLDAMTPDDIVKSIGRL